MYTRFYFYSTIVAIFWLCPLHCMETVPAHTPHGGATPLLQWVMNDCGIAGDAHASALFMHTISTPQTTYLENKQNMHFQTRFFDAAQAIPQLRATTFLNKLAATTNINTKKEVQIASKQCAYFGVIPALDAVSRHYLNSGNASKAMNIMRKISFWQEFSTLCTLNECDDPAAAAFEKTLDNLVKLTAIAAPQKHDPSYTNVIHSIQNTLAARIRNNNLTACTQMATFSLLPQVNNREGTVDAMERILSTFSDDYACLEYIQQHNLLPGLVTLAHNENIHAHALLAHHFFATQKFDAVIEHVNSCRANQSSELFAIGMIARLIHAANSAHQSIFANELQETAEWLCAIAGDDYSHHCIALFQSHCPETLIEQIKTFAHDNPQEHAAPIVLGYILCADKEQMAEEISDWCLYLSNLVSSRYKKPAHDILLHMSAQGNYTASIRLLMILIENDPKNLSVQILHKILDNETASKLLFNYLNKPENIAAITQYTKWRDDCVKARANLLEGYITFSHACTLSPSMYEKALELGQQAVNDVQFALQRKCACHYDLAIISLGIANICMLANHPDTATQWYKRSLKYDNDPVVRLLWAQALLNTQNPSKKDSAKAIKELDASARAGSEQNQLWCSQIFSEGLYGCEKDPAHAYEFLNSYFQNHSDDAAIAFDLLNLLIRCKTDGKNIAPDYQQIYKLCTIALQNPIYQTPAVKLEYAIAAYRTGHIEEGDAAAKECEPSDRIHFNHCVALIKKSTQENEQNKIALLQMATQSLLRWLSSYFSATGERENQLKECSLADYQIIQKALLDGSATADDLLIQTAQSLLALTEDTYAKAETKKKALLTLTQAAENDTGVCLALSELYRAGKVVPQNLEKSVEYLKNIIDKEGNGNPALVATALSKLTYFTQEKTELAMRVNYYVTEKSLSAQERTISRFFSADSTDATAGEAHLESLAFNAFHAANNILCNDFKHLVGQDIETPAFQAIKQRADAGNPRACALLGTAMHTQLDLNNKITNMSEYAQKYLAYLARAYDANQIEKKTLLNAYLINASRFMERNSSQSSLYIDKALELDSSCYDAQALRALSFVITGGNNSTKKATRLHGIDLLKKLADDHKSATAQYYLAILYGHFSDETLRNLVAKDSKVAISYLRAAAQQKFPEAEVLLSRIEPVGSNRYAEAKFKRDLKYNSDIFKEAKDVYAKVNAARKIAALFAQRNRIDLALEWLQKIIDNKATEPREKILASIDATIFCMDEHKEKYLLGATNWLMTAVQYGAFENNSPLNYNSAIGLFKDLIAALEKDPIKYDKQLTILKSELQKRIPH